MEQEFNPTWDEIEEKIREYLQDWAAYMGISHTWEISLIFGETAKDIGLDSEDFSAHVEFVNFYQTARILFNKARFMNRQRYSCWCQVESTCVHELVHLLESELYNFSDVEITSTLQNVLHSSLETVTDRIARVILRARYGGNPCDNDNCPIVKVTTWQE